MHTHTHTHIYIPHDLGFSLKRIPHIHFSLPIPPKKKEKRKKQMQTDNKKGNLGSLKLHLKAQINVCKLPSCYPFWKLDGNN